MSLPQKLSLISLASPRPTVSVTPSSSAAPSASTRRRSNTSSAQPRQSTERFDRASFLVNDAEYKFHSISWSSVEEDETTYDWTHEHISVLIVALERAPSQLETPYTGVLPPSNLLDAIAREIIDVRSSKSEWPHSLRATRLKLIQVAKRQTRLVAKAKTPHTLTTDRSGFEPDVMDVDIPRYSTYAPRTPLHRYKSTDFLPIPEEPHTYLAATPHVPNTPANPHKLQHPSTSQKVTPHAAFHPYKRTPRTPAKIDEPVTPPPRHDEPLDVRPTMMPTTSAPSDVDGAPASLSAASSATLLSSMASRASLTTAVSGTSGRATSSSHKVPRKAKTPRRTRIIEGSGLAADVFGPELPVTPRVGTGLAPKSSETKRLRSRTISTACHAPKSKVPSTPGLQPKTRVTRGHVRSNSASQSYTPAQKQSHLAVPAEIYSELQADEVVRTRMTSRGSLRDNVPPIITTPAPAHLPVTPPSRPPAPTPFLLEPTTPGHRGLRRVGKLNVNTSGGRSHENRAPPSPMQLSPSPHASPLYASTYSTRRQNGASSCRPLSIMSRTSDRSERSALSNISAHSSHSGVSGLNARSPPSRAARMIGRKISFGSDNDGGAGSSLRLHHGTLGAPTGVPSMTMMTLAPAFELR